jgi:hypothetical protein
MRAWPDFPLRRLAGAFAVLVLHAAIIFAFLNATQWRERHVAQTKEIVLHLVNLPAPKSEPVTKNPKHVIARRSAPNTAPPAFFVPPSILNAPQTNGLRQRLFDCSREQLATATPEERAACASASLTPRYDPGAVDYRDHTDRSKSAALWAEDRARKNAPFLLPCMSPGGFNPLYTAYCLGKGAVQGKIDPKDQPGYQDMPQHAANDGDTRMAPAPR